MRATGRVMLVAATQAGQPRRQAHKQAGSQPGSQAARQAGRQAGRCGGGFRAVHQVLEQSRSSRVGNAPILIDQNSDVKIIMRHHSCVTERQDACGKRHFF